jgi:hypothetical protein
MITRNIWKKNMAADKSQITLTSLLQFLKIAAVDQNTIEQALNLPYRDFEDAVQMMAALQVHADYLLTRNVRDYQPAPMEVIQPVELLAIRPRSSNHRLHKPPTQYLLHPLPAQRRYIHRCVLSTADAAKRPPHFAC